MESVEDLNLSSTKLVYEKNRKNAADCSIVQSFMEFMKFFIFLADFFLIGKIPSQIGDTNLRKHAR